VRAEEQSQQVERLGTDLERAAALAQFQRARVELEDAEAIASTNCG